MLQSVHSNHSSHYISKRNMHRIVILIISMLVAFAQGTNSSEWQSSWITGGSNAIPGEFPYQASLRSVLHQNRHFCGGSIINKFYILTAAHCIKGKKRGMIEVMVGTIKLNSGGQSYDVSRIILTPKYNHLNDIGLLRLKKSLVYGSTVQPIALPQQGETTSPGTECTVTGWGRISDFGSKPNNLQQLKVNIISSTECQRDYSFFFHKWICATTASGESPCKGDSGDPLVCGGKQVGILLGAGDKTGLDFCGVYPVKYLEVSNYVDWIKKKMV